MFQASEEKIAIETNLMGGGAHIKVESEEFSDANYDQANCSGTRWITICLSTVFMLQFLCYRFYCCFYNYFIDFICIPINYGGFYLAVFTCFLCSRRRDGIRL